MAPKYANLCSTVFIKNKFLSSYHGPKPDLYKRYIDDWVGATSSTTEELNLFIKSVNSFHPALKYTWEISENSLAFLDIKLSINDNGLSTTVHTATFVLSSITRKKCHPILSISQTKKPPQ